MKINFKTIMFDIQIKSKRFHTYRPLNGQYLSTLLDFNAGIKNFVFSSIHSFKKTACDCLSIPLHHPIQSDNVRPSQEKKDKFPASSNHAPDTTNHDSLCILNISKHLPPTSIFNYLGYNIFNVIFCLHFVGVF